MASANDRKARTEGAGVWMLGARVSGAAEFALRREAVIRKFGNL